RVRSGRGRGRGCAGESSFRLGSATAGHLTVRGGFAGGVARGDQGRADEHRIGSRGGIGRDVRGGGHGGFADREGAGGDPGQQIGGAAEVDGEVLEVAGVGAGDVRLAGEGALV